MKKKTIKELSDAMKALSDKLDTMTEEERKGEVQKADELTNNLFDALAALPDRSNIPLPEEVNEDGTCVAINPKCTNKATKVVKLTSKWYGTKIQHLCEEHFGIVEYPSVMLQDGVEIFRQEDITNEEQS